MQLTTAQIQLVKRSWKSLRGIRPELIADIFYTKLFTDHPRLRKMFPADMQLQYNKLMDMLNSIIVRLDHLEDWTGEITAMAQRHVGYGVKAQHYTVVGNALLWTLKQGLGKDWSPELEAAWAACYQTLTNLMLDAEKHAG